MERETLVNRYVPNALNSIYHLMNEQHPEDQNKLDKYGQKVDEIKEESDVDSDNDEDIEDEKLVENNKTDDLVKKESDAKQENDEEQIVTTKNELQENDDKEVDLDNKNFEDLDQSSFSIISKEELKKNYDHLSNFDPDDEFLKSEQSFSVIGSVVSKDEEILSEYSDFSIVSNARLSNIKNSNVIQTERDIYIEDIAMQKIIYYISFFSDDVKRYLNKMRSKDGLLQMDQNELQIDFLEVELDNIDTELVKLILDVLEHFDMFRLCLIVCNRYGMQEHVSRYLTSICYKYSNIKYLNGTKILSINDDKFRKQQKQVNVLANEAIHSMLKLIDPNMIKQAKTEDIKEGDRSLNAECWRYIYYLGFWKKLIYIMDTHTSLQL